MLKFLRVLKQFAAYYELIGTLNISAGIIRMVQVLSLQFFSVHLMACFWFLSATFEDNIFNTWVGARGIVDATRTEQYIQSLYWSFQTVTTVGYGDFSISTTTEFMIAIWWIFWAIIFYTFIIGNVSSIIEGMDEKAGVLNSKLNTLNEFSLKYEIPDQTRNKIKNFFENQAKSKVKDGDWEAIYNSLPHHMKQEIINTTHGEIIKGIFFFRDKPEAFLQKLIPSLKVNNLFRNDILYS